MASEEKIALKVDQSDGENGPDDGLAVIDGEWPQISQRLGVNNDYLAMEISADSYDEGLIPQLRQVIGRHKIKAIGQQLYRDMQRGSWFLVFRLDQNTQAIDFEALYIELPAGVVFHFFRRSPVMRRASHASGQLPQSKANGET
jgi:hypothetical protein